MAKFKFIEWLVSYLESQDFFLFDWDQGNSTKNHTKHGITLEEIESCFIDPNILVLGQQYQPVVEEDRYGLIAKSSISKKIIFVCFAIREGKIRAISARVANKNERELYEE